MKKYLILLTLGVSLHITAQKTLDVNTLMKQLTLEEKVKLVVGAGMNWNPDGGTVIGATEEKVPGAAGTSNAIERLGIAKEVFSDGPAGVRINPERKNSPGKKYYATAFPVGTLLASTFDPEIITKVGMAFGNETKEYGIDFLLAPALNIHRNPLGGRNFEYYSEDPVVAGKTAAAFTRGVQSQGVGVSLKHFVANNQETNRSTVNTIVSERAMREIYLKGFEIAVKESDPWTVMSSYNKVDGVYTSENKELLTTILRDEWGFKGFVMTDWFGGKDPVAQMKAGNDLLMPGSPKQSDTILQAIKDGRLPIEVLDKNVRRILEIYSLTPSFRNYKYSNAPDLEGHKQVSRNAATDGMVLLKNENQVLPLNKDKGTIGLFGVGSFKTIAGGTGSGDVNKAYMISIEQGLANAGFQLDKNALHEMKMYLDVQDSIKKLQPKRPFMPETVIEEKLWNQKQLDEYAKNNAAAIFTLTRTSGEGFDRTVTNDFNLKEDELTLIRQLCNAFHAQKKPVIVLLNIGGVIETASWKSLPDAVLLVWQPGQEGGDAVVDILSGKVSPSGKLPMTFPLTYNDVPSAKNFPGKVLDTTQKPSFFRGVPAEVRYEEDIFVGYRYYDTYKVNVSYPFGFGLSYTSFKIDGVKLKVSAEGELEINCIVSNSGKTAGKEVVEVYISSSQGRLKKPVKELKAFAKTRNLKPGEQQALTFNLKPYDFASYDTESSSWIVENGEYSVLLGDSSDALQVVGKFNRPSTEMVAKAHKVLENR